MRIRGMRIQNFRAIKDLTVNFLDGAGRIRPITVFAGPNGCGKTSVVFAIVQALRGVMGYRTEDVPDPSELDIHRKTSDILLSGMPLAKTPLQMTVNLEVEFDQAERESIPQIFEDTRELHGEHAPAKLPDGRVSIEWKYPPERNPDGSTKPFWLPSRVEPWQGEL